MNEKHSERKWWMWYGALVIIITTIPYYIAYSQDYHHLFTGFIFGVEDGNSYIAKMLSGANGNWLFKTPYSTQNQRGFLAFFPYLLLGKLTAGSAQHEQLVVLFHAYRCAASLFLIYATYQLASVLIINPSLRKICTVIATVGGGLGWLIVLDAHRLFQIQIPLEFYSPETFGFLSLLGLPHLAAARAFLFFGFIFYLRKEQSGRTRLLASLSWLMIGFFQPLTIATGWIYISAHITFVFIIQRLLWKVSLKTMWLNWKSNILTAVLMMLASSPWVIYNLISFSSDPYLTGWVSQNIIKSPPFVDYLFSFGLMILLALPGIWMILTREKKPALLLPAIIVLLFPLLAYVPHNLQRRFPEGIWFAMTIAGFYMLDGTRIRHAKTISSALLVISLISPIIILVGGIQAALTPYSPLYRSAEEINAFNFIADNVSEGSVIASSYKTANALPAWAPVTVMTGHGPESVNLEETERALRNFFSERFDRTEEIDFLEEFSVDFVVYGPFEHEIGNWNPDELFYQIVYDEGQYQIYRVIDLHFNEE